MTLDRPSLRLQIMVLVSLVAHFGIIQFFAGRKFSEAPKRLELTEVEFQEEIAKPTEMEKLMGKLVAAPKPAAPVPQQKDEQIEAMAELEKTSFRQAAGIKKTARMDEVNEKDLLNLAALPKLDVAKPAALPRGAGLPAPKISLAASRPPALSSLQSQVVPLDSLPAMDLGPGISRQAFQQPEAIVQKVKAEKREQQRERLGSALSLKLQRGAFITGEVQNRSILHQKMPEVPRWLEEKGIEAEVVIAFVVNPDGEVGDKVFVQKTSGYAELDRLAIAALKQFAFAPLPLNVKQSEQQGVIVIRFVPGSR